jgi:hypothetical protein
VSWSEREGALEKARTCPYCGEARSTQADHNTSLKRDWESGGWADERGTRTARANDPKNLRRSGGSWDPMTELADLVEGDPPA